MKRLSLIFIVAIMLFSGCRSNEFRNVDLADFEYQYNKGEVGISTITITPKTDIKELNITYHLKSYNEIVETRVLNCGDLTADRVYSFLFDSKPYGFVNNGLEVISATGKVSKKAAQNERDVAYSDIKIDENIYYSGNVVFFAVTPKVYAKDLFVTFTLVAEKKDSMGKTTTKNLDFMLTKFLRDVEPGTQYTIEFPVFELEDNYFLSKAHLHSLKGLVLL